MVYFNFMKLSVPVITTERLSIMRNLLILTLDFGVLNAKIGKIGPWAYVDSLIPMKLQSWDGPLQMSKYAFESNSVS